MSLEQKHWPLTLVLIDIGPFSSERERSAIFCLYTVNYNTVCFVVSWSQGWKRLLLSDRCRPDVTHSLHALIRCVFSSYLTPKSQLTNQKLFCMKKRNALRQQSMNSNIAHTINVTVRHRNLFIKITNTGGCKPSHLADAYIQSNLHYIHCTHFKTFAVFLSTANFLLKNYTRCVGLLTKVVCIVTLQYFHVN